MVDRAWLWWVLDLRSFLLWVGLIRERDGAIRWPFSVCPWWIWKVKFLHPFDPVFGGWVGFFRNREDVIKWLPGRLLPRRWGIYIIGLEIGDRGG